ncbi:C6 transcription factor [Cladophialophora carrionii]|uniref:C6 transcription factor n=1 Tax=Cladophialophora carrionii TaxID=86049 RepID=A0A1C1CAF0_9EURO|nr:C6 transcription factor [Cladophialophora carrionii]
MALAGSEPMARVGGLSKRAPRACESCRARKVRLDSKTCVLPASRRRHVGDRILGSSFLEGNQHNPQSPICDAIIDFGDTKPVRLHNHIEKTHAPPRDGSFDVFDLAESPLSINDKAVGVGCPTKDNAINSKAYYPASLLTPYPSPTQSLLDCPLGHWMLPNYITPIPRSISGEDLQYLNNKGAFDIPDTQLRDQLLEAYARWIHPFAPMLDLEQILTAIFTNGERGTLSLLLFQSILFAASAYVHTDYQQGNRKRLRKTFYERARLLHDFDAETDRLSLCQAAILLSLWDGQPGSVRDSYHWIGIATLHATSLGLNVTPPENLVETRRQRTLNKTWWTLLVRDRLLAVAMRRPVQNKVFRFDAPMLHLLDFRPEPLVEVLRKTLHLKDVTVRHMETLVSLWMALAQLSEYIDKVLNLQYTSQRASALSGQGSAVMSLVPQMDVSKSSEIRACGLELQNWYGYLPKEVQLLDVASSRPDDIETIRVHRQLLAGYYSMTLMTLYRPLLNLQSTVPSEATLCRESMKIVSQAAASITDIFKDLYADNLISRLPDTAIAVLEPAVATHLLCSMSVTPTVRDSSFQKFYLCWRILLQFKQTYHLADMTMSMLDAAAKRLKSPSDLKALKKAAFSQLMDELASADEEAARTYMAVPFLGVVGEQKTNRSDVVNDWPRQSRPRREPSFSGGTGKDLDQSFEVDTESVLDLSPFDELMCLDDLEAELLL